jgi:hypothetical protein
MTLSQAASRGLLQQARLKLGSIQQQAAADGRITSVERIKVSEQAKILDTALAQTAGMKGSGRLEIQVGPHALVIPGAQFEVDSRGRIAILGGAVEVKGITHMVGRGSYISPTEVKLVGWIPLANYAISNSTLTFRPSGITGSGRLQAFAHAFSLRYDLSGPRLRAAAETGGPDRGWQSIPFANGAQFQSTGARIRLQVDGPNVAATVRIPTLGIRTTAARPDGKPWVESSSSAVTATIAVNGDVIVTPPGLANPGDPFRAAREACEAAARAAHVIPDVSSLLVGEAKRLAEEARDRAIAALNAALAECRAKNPPPPNSPTLPPRMTVKVGNLVG